MVYAFIIHVIANDSARLVYQRYFSQENVTGHHSDLNSKERTMNLRGMRVPTPTSTSTSTPTQSPSCGSFGITASVRTGTKDLLHEKSSNTSSPLSFHECHGNQQTSLNSKELIMNRRQQSQNVAEYVQSEYLFRRAISHSGRTMEEDLTRLNNEDVLPEFEKGFMRLPPGEPYRTEKISFWLAAANCCFTFVLEGHENRSVAETVLKKLISIIQEHLHVLNQPSETFLKVDKVDLILDRFLPGGQLLFMNHRLSRQLERQIEQMMKS